MLLTLMVLFRYDCIAIDGYNPNRKIGFKGVFRVERCNFIECLGTFYEGNRVEPDGIGIRIFYDVRMRARQNYKSGDTIKAYTTDSIRGVCQNGVCGATKPWNWVYPL